MEKQRIPSTDPSVWNGTFKVGDKVKVRIDFSDITDTNAISEIIEVVKDNTPFKLDKNGNNIGGFARPENPSGSLYILSNGGNWEGKDLELVSQGVSKQTEEVFKPEIKKEVSATQKTKVSFNNTNIQEKIKEYNNSAIKLPSGLCHYAAQTQSKKVFL